jgi:hypothetical protein
VSPPVADFSDAVDRVSEQQSGCADEVVNDDDSAESRKMEAMVLAPAGAAERVDCLVLGFLEDGQGHAGAMNWVTVRGQTGRGRGYWRRRNGRWPEVFGVRLKSMERHGLGVYAWFKGV